MKIAFNAKEGYIITSKCIYATKLDKEGILFDDVKKFYRQDLRESNILTSFGESGNHLFI